MPVTIFIINIIEISVWIVASSAYVYIVHIRRNILSSIWVQLYKYLSNELTPNLLI